MFKIPFASIEEPITDGQKKWLVRALESVSLSRKIHAEKVLATIEEYQAEESKGDIAAAHAREFIRKHKLRCPVCGVPIIVLTIGEGISFGCLNQDFVYPGTFTGGDIMVVIEKLIEFIHVCVRHVDLVKLDYRIQVLHGEGQ